LILRPHPWGAEGILPKRHVGKKYEKVKRRKRKKGKSERRKRKKRRKKKKNGINKTIFFLLPASGSPI
jgi:hypothetical protein